MFRRGPKVPKTDERICSFCHKSENVVGKLISNPDDYPRAYICDECIAVCNSILEDERGDPGGLRDQFLLLTYEWIRLHDGGEDASEVFDQMLIVARQIFDPPKRTDSVGWTFKPI